MALIFERQQRRGQELERLMRTLSHTSVLERGYAIVLGNGGLPVKEAAHLNSGEAVTLRFKDGDVGATIDGENRPDTSKPVRSKAVPSTAASSKNKKTSQQGSLF